MSKKDILLAGIITLLTVLLFAPFASIFMDPHHDGIMLKPALDVLSGQVLFRETFSQYGPLTTYLQVVALAVNPTLLSLRMLTVIAYAGSLGLLYLTWSSILPRSLALVGCVFFVLVAAFYHPEWPMIPWSSTLALLFQSAALLAFSRIIAGDRSGVWAWILGITCACAFWCRQPVGIMLTGAAAIIVVALHLTGWRHPEGKTLRLWTRALMGFAGVSLLILGHLAIHGAAGAWWLQNIEWPRRWAGGEGGDNFWVFVHFFLSQSSAMVLGLSSILVFGPSLVRMLYGRLPIWVDYAWIGVCSLGYLFWGAALRPSLLIETGGWRTVIFAVLAAQALWVIIQAIALRTDKRGPAYYQVAAMSGLALASMAQVYPVACANHVFWALAPGFGLFVYVVRSFFRIKPSCLVFALLVLLTPAIYEKCRWAEYKLNRPYVTLGHPAVLAGMKVEKPMAEAIENVQRVIGPLLAANPDQKVMLYGDDAMYLTWFNNRENATPYYVTWPGLAGPEELDARWRYLVLERPVVLLNGPSAATLKAIPRDYRLVIHEPGLALRVLVPRHVAPELPEVQLVVPGSTTR